MGTLTPYLQREFARLCPPGFTCRPEARVLSESLEKTLGYSARADGLLQRTDGSRRCWIEFEISRVKHIVEVPDTLHVFPDAFLQGKGAALCRKC